MAVEPHELGVALPILRAREDLLLGVAVVEQAPEPASPPAVERSVDVLGGIGSLVMDPVLAGEGDRVGRGGGDCLGSGGV